MPLEFSRENKETLPDADLLSLSPGGASFGKTNVSVPPKFDAVLKWQTFQDPLADRHLLISNSVESKLKLFDQNSVDTLRLYHNDRGYLTTKPQILLSYRTRRLKNSDLVFFWAFPSNELADASFSDNGIRFVAGVPGQPISAYFSANVTGNLFYLTIVLRCDAGGESITRPEEVIEYFRTNLRTIDVHHSYDSDGSGFVRLDEEWKRFTIDYDQLLPRQPLYDPLFTALMWQGTYRNCWTKWKIRMVHNHPDTLLPYLMPDLPFFRNELMSQEATWTEDEALYRDVRSGNIHVPRYWGQKPMPGSSGTGGLRVQPPQFYDCRRYLFSNFPLRTFIYVFEPEYTGDPWHDLAWPRWIKENGKKMPDDRVHLAKDDPNDLLTNRLPPSQWYAGGGNFIFLPCLVEIEGTVYPNKWFKGPALGSGKARLEFVYVDYLNYIEL
jgi:hypothetical protein